VSVRDGLHEGDVIVVNGLQRVRPGDAVTPKKVSMATPSNALSESIHAVRPCGSRREVARAEGAGNSPGRPMNISNFLHQAPNLRRG